MHMRCPHCGRLLVGLRHDHAVLCAREGLFRMLREAPAEAMATVRPPKVQLSEQELEDYLDGTLTRSELSVHRKSA